MNEIRKVTTKSGNEYEFFNESGSTRYGFYHKSKLFINGCFVDTNKCNYLNRTWERYMFQTSMRGCIYNLQNKRREHLLDVFKFTRGYKKLTAKRTEEFELVLKADGEYNELEEVYEALK